MVSCCCCCCAVWCMREQPEFWIDPRHDSISALKEESLRLARDVREVCGRIRENGGADRGQKRRPTDADRDAPGKRSRQDMLPKPKLMSAIAVVVPPSGPEDDTSGRWDPNNEAEVHSAKPATRAVEKQPDAMRRNRRMFGALMGHLDTARRNLERDSTIKVQESVETNVVEKNREQIRVATREEKEKELALRDQLLAKQLKNDIALATACWKKNLISTQGFCVTDSEPRLAWMPGVLDDGVEEYVDLQKRRKEVDALIEARIESDNSRIEEINEDCAQKRAARQASGDCDEKQTAADEQGSHHGDEDGEENGQEEREDREC